jgi:hypothetical protein
LADHALHHLRAAQGIIALGERYGAERLDAACRRALEVGDPSYRTVKGILAVGADQQAAGGPDSAGPISAASAATPAHLHGPQGLFAHLDEPAAPAAPVGAASRRWAREPGTTPRVVAAHVEAALLRCEREGLA